MTVALPELRFHETLYQRRLGLPGACVPKWLDDDGSGVPAFPGLVESVPLVGEAPILLGSGRGVYWVTSRYVDNRATISARAPSLPAVPAALRDPGFYDPPVQMVAEPTLDYLELTLSVKERQVQGVFRVAPAEQQWRYRSAASSGSDRVLKGVCTGRLVAAATMAFPLNNKRLAVAQLFSVYLQLGLSSAILDDLLRSQARRFPVVYKPLIAPATQAIRDRNHHLLKPWSLTCTG